MSPIEVLKEKARDWGKKVVVLNNTPVPPEYQAEKDKLIQWAKLIKTGIEKIFGTIDEVETMGAVPLLIPIAAIGAAAAGITKWTLDYQKFMTKINRQKELVTGGLSNDQAVRVINDLENKSQFMGTLATKVALPILGLGLLLKFVSK